VKLGIFLPNWIGDVVMATPTLRALRNHFGPQSRMVGIMRPYVADVLAGTSWLDDQIFCNPRSKDPGLRGVQLWRRLRQEKFDVAILMTNSIRTALWSRVSGAPERVGYAHGPRSILLTHHLRRAMIGRKFAPTPTLDFYLELAYAVGCPIESPRMELATLPPDEAAADHVWATLNLNQKQVVVLNSGAAYGASKLWPPEYFGELGRRIATDWGHMVLVICGPNERTIAREIVAHAAHPRVVSLVDPRLGENYPLPLGLSKACVRRSQLMITTDSGPRHFAPAFDVPVITMFGPTPISLSETHYSKAIHLHHEVDCGPCLQRECPLKHHRCMRDLTVDQVYRAVQIQLQAKRGQAA
jgi:heptosyltransferase-2